MRSGGAELSRAYLLSGRAPDGVESRRLSERGTCLGRGNKMRCPPWEKVLAKLPRSFTMDDVTKKTPALKDHRQARVIAVARWSRSGVITKTAPGKYRKGARKAA